MGHFYYGRHFAALGVATLLIFLLSHWDLLNDSLLVSFAINGALHAIALIAALRTPHIVWRKLAFVALAAAFSVFTMYVGIAGLVIFAALPGNERLYAVLALCSVTGAITYGSLTRLFWLGKFPSRLILAIALLCLLSAWLAFFVRPYLDVGGWWLAAAWWFAFSIPLFRRVPEPKAALSPEERRGESPIRATMERLGNTARELRVYKQGFLMLLAFLIYNDGIGTIIRMAWSGYSPPLAGSAAAQTSATAVASRNSIVFSRIFFLSLLSLGMPLIAILGRGGKRRRLHGRQHAPAEE